jgi:CheY-like chemotaxis protein
MDYNLLNILLVEDDYLDIMNFEREFKKIKSKFSLHIAKNGKEAWNMLKGEQGFEKLDPTPLIIVLDLNMPKMNGIEFMKLLRSDQEFNKVKVFMTTTSNEDGDKLIAKSLGISGYIVKPVTFEKYSGNISSVDTFSLFIELLK